MFGSRFLTVLVIMTMTTSSGCFEAIFDNINDTRRDMAFIQIKQISEALNLYKSSFQEYPSTSEGLQALVASKDGRALFMTSVPKDPWGRDYVYRFPGIQKQGGFDLISYGPDGVQGNDDDIVYVPTDP